LISYHVIYINDERKTNRDYVDEVLGSNKINIDSLNAKDPVALQEFKEKYPEVKPGWSGTKLGELGNFASHYLAWTYLAESNLENLLVFEDDTLIELNFINLFCRLLFSAFKSPPKRIEGTRSCSQVMKYCLPNRWLTQYGLLTH
jgi:GR25 family glycosyltransferase involved in LPS biosynthesis